MPLEFAQWLPGKYIAFKARHFVGVEVFHDGEICLYGTCRRADGLTVTALQLHALSFEQVYRLQPLSGVSGDLIQESSGGAREWPLADSLAFRSVLQFAASLKDVPALVSTNRATSHLLQQASFWRSSLLFLQPCACREICASSVIRCLWPSGALATLMPQDVAPCLQHRSRGSDAATRRQYIWSGVPERGAAAAFEVRQPRDFWAAVSPGAALSHSGCARSDPNAALLVGFSCLQEPADILRCVCSQPASEENELHWYTRVPIRRGELPTSFIVMARGVRQVAGAVIQPGSLVSQIRSICAAFCATEMRLYLDSRLFGVCQLPDHLAYPSHARTMRPFLAIETDSDLGTFGKLAIHSARIAFATPSRLPFSAMQFFEFGGVTSQDLWVDEDMLVFLGAPGAIQCVQVCSQDLLRRLSAMTLFVGFTDMNFASLVGRTLKGLPGLRRMQTRARIWGVRVEVTAGKCLHQCLYDSSRRDIYDIILDPAAEMCLASRLDMSVGRQQSSVTCRLNHAAAQAWECERVFALNHMVRPVIAVAPECFVDCRAFIHAMRSMTIEMTCKFADGQVLSCPNVFSSRPWMNADRCGGASDEADAEGVSLSGSSDTMFSEACIRTPSSIGWADTDMARPASWGPQLGFAGTRGICAAGASHPRNFFSDCRSGSLLVPASACDASASVVRSRSNGLTPCRGARRIVCAAKCYQHDRFARKALPPHDVTLGAGQSGWECADSPLRRHHLVSLCLCMAESIP